MNPRTWKAEGVKVKSRLFFIAGCFFLFLAAVSLVKAEEAAKDPTKPSATDVKKTSTPIALTVEALQEIEERKTSLDLREKQLSERARDLEIQEKLLKEKLKKMEDLNKKMAERLDSFKKDHEQRITKLVNVVEGMKPEAAARYVEALDPDLAVEILARIKEQKASKILNLVDKKMSARLTELYTGYRESIEEPQAPPVKEATPTNKPM
jgi:flagellar motility protein MotE (MotC chaperone)